MARVFTGSQAAKAKLVDNIGGLRETELAAASAVGIRGEPDVVEYSRKHFLETVFGGENDDSSSALQKAVGRELIDGLRRDGSGSPLR